MARGWNEIRLLGNIASVPEVKETPKSSLVTFRMAVPRGKMSKKDDQAVFVTINCWGKLGEIVSRYAGKGSKIFVGGYLDIQRYVAKNGQQSWFASVVADDVVLLGHSVAPGEYRKDDGKDAEPPQNDVPF